MKSLKLFVKLKQLFLHMPVDLSVINTSTDICIRMYKDINLNVYSSYGAGGFNSMSLFTIRLCTSKPMKLVKYRLYIPVKAGH